MVINSKRACYLHLGRVENGKVIVDFEVEDVGDVAAVDDRNRTTLCLALDSVDVEVGAAGIARDHFEEPFDVVSNVVGGQVLDVRTWRQVLDVVDVEVVAVVDGAAVDVDAFKDDAVAVQRKFAHAACMREHIP